MTDAEKRELAQLEAQYGGGGVKKPSSGGLTPAEEAELASLEKQHGPGLGMKALSVLGKGLDYAGGVTRAVAANAADAVNPGKEFATSDDIVNALKANPPSTADYLERAGVPAGYSMSDALSGLYSKTGDGLALKKGGMLDPTARGAAGFVGDVALDPLTYLSGGLSAAAKGGLEGSRLAKAGQVALKTANAVVNPLDALVPAGKTLYQSGLKNIDTRLVERGQEPVSDYLMKQGAWGRLPTLQDNMKSRMGELAEQRQGLYQKIDNAGVQIDPHYASEGANNYISDLRDNRYMAPKADKLQEFVDLGTSGGPMSVQKASEAKTSLYDALPATAFDQNGRLTNDGQKMLKELSLGYKTEIEGAGNFVQPGLGDQIGDVNKEWGAYINADKPTQREIAKDARKNLFTETKAAFMKFKPAAVPLMYGAQMINSPATRTGAGLLMKNIGESAGPVSNAASREFYLEMLRQLQNQNQGDYNGPTR